MTQGAPIGRYKTPELRYILNSQIISMWVRHDNTDQQFVDIVHAAGDSIEALIALEVRKGRAAELDLAVGMATTLSDLGFEEWANERAIELEADLGAAPLDKEEDK